MDYLAAVCAQVIKSRVRRTKSRSEKILTLLFLFYDAWENVKAFQQISLLLPLLLPPCYNKNP